MSDQALTPSDYAVLADFRRTLRRFLAFSEARAAEQGLTPQQHQALLAIKAAAPGQASVGGLAESLLLMPHSATGLADRLQALALIERRASVTDRRRAELVLTPKAEAVLAALSLTHREELRRLGPMLTELLGRIGG